MTHFGLCVSFINCVMSCLSNISFSNLINGATYDFFKPSRGLRQGCSLSMLIFLTVVEDISRAL